MLFRSCSERVGVLPQASNQFIVDIEPRRGSLYGALSKPPEDVLDVNLSSWEFVNLKGHSGERMPNSSRSLCVVSPSGMAPGFAR